MTPRLRSGVAGDDPSLRMVLRKRLTDQSFRVFEAEDGPSGLALAKREKPDLILLDINDARGRRHSELPCVEGGSRYKGNSYCVFISALAEGLTQVQQGSISSSTKRPTSTEICVQIVSKKEQTRSS